MEAKTISIFLIDGEPNGLRTAELSNWVGKAIIIPRNKLKDAKQRSECNKPAVYFLVEENKGEILPAAYIGETENLWQRLSNHDNRKGPSWLIAIAFVKTDDNLTKSHVKYLEYRCIEIASEVKRCKLKNDNKSKATPLSERDIADMEGFLNNLRLLLAAVGYPILQEVTSKAQPDTSDPLFSCEGKGARATGRMINDGFVVYKGSTASTQISKSAEKKNQKYIGKLVSGGFVVEKDDLYVFVKDHIFSSPSMASEIILGRSTNGWKEWKTEKGETLSEIYRPD